MFGVVFVMVTGVAMATGEGQGGSLGENEQCTQDSYIDTDGYSENGAGAWNQKIKGYDVDSFVSRIGAKADYQFSSKLVGELSGSYSHEFANQEVKIDSKFDRAGTSYRSTSGLVPDKDSFIIGAGLVGAINEKMVGFVNYDLELKDDFVGHTTMVGLRCSF